MQGVVPGTITLPRFFDLEKPLLKPASAVSSACPLATRRVVPDVFLMSRQKLAVASNTTVSRAVPSTPTSTAAALPDGGDHDTVFLGGVNVFSKTANPFGARSVGVIESSRHAHDLPRPYRRDQASS